MNLFDNTIESVILSACFNSRDNSAFIKQQNIEPSDFYFGNNRIIYSEILEIHDKGLDVDLIIVKTNLQAKGLFEKVGGDTYLISIYESTSLSTNLKHFTDKLKDLSARRKLQALGISSDDRSKTPAEIVQELQSKLKDIDSKTEIKVITAEEMFDKPVESFPLKKEDYVKTGIDSFDRITYGLFKSEVVTIAARPSQGKSSLALTIMRNVSESIPVIYFSLEMPEQFIAIKLLAMESNINSIRIQHNLGVLKDPYEKKKLDESRERLKQLNFRIVDKSAMKSASIERICYEEFENNGLGLVIIDYLQIMSSDSKDQRYIQIAKDMKVIKNIARDLTLPVITLSQLGREVETRPKQIPILKDLREAGDIENDSDKVLFLYYDNWQEVKSDPINYGKILIAKNKYGSIGNADITFEKQYSRFI